MSRPRPAEVASSTPRPVRTVAAAVALLLCTGGISTYASVHVVSTPSGWQSWVFVYPVAIAGAVGAIGWVRDVDVARLHAWTWPAGAVLAFSTWALLSATWSVAPDATTLHAALGVGTALLACWFGRCLTVAEQIWAVAGAGAAAVAASAFVIAWRPEHGKMFPDALPGSYWQGIFGNRNSLAPVCVLALIGVVGVVALRPSVRRVALAVPFAALDVVVLKNSAGMTSRVAVAATIVVSALVVGGRRIRRSGVGGGLVAGIAGSIALLAGVVVVRNLDWIAGEVGRDVTLTGRRPIWADVRSFIADRPVRGYGYWAFWERPDLTAASYGRLGAYGSAHNSFLEVVLGLGAIGAVLFSVIVLTAVAGIARWCWRSDGMAAWWWSVLLVFVLVQHSMESFVLWHSYLWVLLAAGSVVWYRSAAAGAGGGLPPESGAEGAASATRLGDQPPQPRPVRSSVGSEG